MHTTIRTALFTLAIVAALAQPHYRFPVLPLVAILAAGFLARRHLDEPTLGDDAEPAPDDTTTTPKTAGANA